VTPHLLSIRLGDRLDMTWAQATVRVKHYLQQPVDPRARPMVYLLEWKRMRIGLIMLGIPHATRNAGWWGYGRNLPTQWQVVDLCRIWIDPDFQRGGCMCQAPNVPGYVDRHGSFRPTTATWAIREILARVQADRVRLWPPVFPAQPYHIRLAISYSDPRFHRGTIYRLAGAEPMYRDRCGEPAPGPSGKYGWAWKLPEPTWSWQHLQGISPRTMRLDFTSANAFLSSEEEK
jgi:hypothetical protein